MIQETFSTFQLPHTLTQQIMERIHHLKPTPAPISRPLTPWIAATTLVVVALFFGAMQSARFQLPYTLDDTESTMTVELTEDAILDMPMPKRTIGRDSGASQTGDLGNGIQSNGSALALAAADSQEGRDSEEAGWRQTNGPYGGIVLTFLATPEGTIYAGTQGAGVLRLSDNSNSWIPVNTGLTVYNGRISISSLEMMEDTLYAASGFDIFRSLAVVETTFYAGTSGEGIFRLEAGDGSWTYLGVPNERIDTLAVSGTKIFAGAARGGIFRSVDGGKSWTKVDEGLTERSIQNLVFVGKALYAGTFGDGVFRSVDDGDSWVPVNEGLTDTTITVLSVSGTTLYAGTHYHGVFRLENGNDLWEHVGEMHRDVRSLAVSETTLYAGTMDGGVFRISLGESKM